MVEKRLTRKYDYVDAVHVYAATPVPVHCVFSVLFDH